MDSKINHLYLGGIMLFSKNENVLEILIQSIRIYNHDTGREFCIEICTMLISRSRKNNGKTVKLRKTQNASRKEKIQLFGSIENRFH